VRMTRYRRLFLLTRFSGRCYDVERKPRWVMS
jgi:hypothetical protein